MADSETSGIIVIEDRTPAVYKKIRPWFPKIMIAGSTLMMAGSAPLWVTTFCLFAFIIQFLPDDKSFPCSS